MKKILILTIACAALLVSSCEKFLDQAPTNGESMEYIFQDYTRASRYLTQLYYNMPPIGSGKLDSYGFLEGATDMAEYSANYGKCNSSFNVGNWLNASYEVTSTWSRCYKQIRRAWIFLENMNQFNNEPEGRKVYMEGECKFMLAFHYFELMKRYGGVPIVKQSLTLDDDLMIPRSTVDELASYINELIDEAEELLPEKWDLEDLGHATKVWAMALRSRVSLYYASPLFNTSNDQARWLTAAKASRKLIDHLKDQSQYKLADDWQNIFMREAPGTAADENSEMIIYKRTSDAVYTFNSSIINYNQAPPSEDFWGNGSNCPTQNFVDRFPVITYDAAGNAIGTEDFDWNNPDHVANIYKNRDPRFYYTILYNGRFWIKRQIGTWRDATQYGPDINPKDHQYTRTGYYLRKFWPRECVDKVNPGSTRIWMFYMRLGEVYLNYAEAMNEVYGPDTDNLGMDGTLTAIDAINVLRARLLCPASETIKDNVSDPYYYTKVERDENPDFPVLPNGLPGMKTGMSQTQAREKIRNERIIELAFEDQYFYDILRWKEGQNLIGGTVYGVDIVKNGETYTYTRTKVEDRVYNSPQMELYPIPSSEVYKLNLEQNPGW